MTMNMRDAGPEYRSQQFKKNGHIPTGKQKHQRKDCGHQFVVGATHRVIDQEHRMVVERLLEKIALPGIYRAIGVRIRRLMDFLVARFAAVPADLQVQLVISCREVLRGCL